jgi:hypothetical protein
LADQYPGDTFTIKFKGNATDIPIEVTDIAYKPLIAERFKRGPSTTSLQWIDPQSGKNLPVPFLKKSIERFINWMQSP